MDDVADWRRVSAGAVGVIVDCSFCEHDSKFVFSTEDWKVLVDEWDGIADEFDRVTATWAFDVYMMDDVQDFLDMTAGRRMLDPSDVRCGCGKCGR